ncbi:succinate dehydrogenase assembly factor 2 [Sulfitobacter sp. JBTF-M27]|uniref:FAD assembly factor SdhE n=1 Tax=Sulfitobacter sediminilitoris TaxID=2698830 RepID=A0A6P0C5A9_9RHOB|nr:succinate dehydrogenase assembly factor 2 [Sulfitobacter sediminilitoris]NEK21282.1 succinate dehydrogenase assembly factor 2 [Sulfitobacter sediminilitoris]
MSELREHKIKRLHMRSIRRGIKEMDLILSAYAGARLEAMTDADLTLYDALLNENDHDLYQWVTGQTDAPANFSEVIADIRTLYSPQV